MRICWISSLTENSLSTNSSELIGRVAYSTPDPKSKPRDGKDVTNTKTKGHVCSWLVTKVEIENADIRYNSFKPFKGR